MILRYENLYKVNVSTMLIITLLFSFTFSAPIQYCCANMRIILILLFFTTSMYTIVGDFKNKLYTKNYIFLVVIGWLGLISLNITHMPQQVALRELYMVVAIILGFFAFRYYDKFKSVLIVMIYFNFLAMGYELLSGEYIFELSDIGHAYQSSRLKGLFSYSKEVTGFLISAAIIFRKENKLVLVILFLSSLMTGSRTGMIFIITILSVEAIYYIKNNTSIKSLFYIAVLMSFILFIANYYLLEHPSMYARVENSFNFESSSNMGRIHAWTEHLRVISDFSLLHLIFGNTGFANNLLGTGAENDFLTTIGNNGLIGFIIVYIPIIFFAILSVLNFYKFYPFLLILVIFQVTRYSGGWSGGIMLWAYLFKLFNSPYISYILKRGIDEKNNILFLLSHQPNPRFIKQINYLSDSNHVDVLYYYRDYMKDLSSEYDKNCILNESIGSITNGSYLQRIGKYIKSIKELYKTMQNNNYDVLIINNIDVLALFKLCTLFQNNKTKIIIEISDLRDHTYINTLKSDFIRIIEKFMFRYVDKLIVTSPKFYDVYYDKLFKKEYFILENKPLSNMIPKILNKIESKKVIIGIVGLLLQGNPYKTLFETLKNDERYEIHIYGKGTFQDLVEEYSNKYKNIKYFGEYNFFKDSANIYASLDILYMPYDTTSGSLNNKIALPNKFYEAMYFQVPIITSKETYLGELVEKYSIGITVKCCIKKELENAIESINSNRKLFCDRFKNLQKEIYLADSDYIKLEKYIFKLESE